MKKSALLPLQTAVFGLLNGQITGGAYDHVPKGAAFPYTVIGEDTGADWSTKDVQGEESTVTIHVWSQKPGASECKTIMDQIEQKLTAADVAVTGFGSSPARLEYKDVTRDPDGISRHGVLRFRFQMLQEA